MNTSYLKLYSLIILTIILVNINCQADDPITIHVVPHTHDDVGWIWTINDYYEGTGGATVRVHSILDNMVVSLSNKTDRTFIYVEMAYFIRWYKDLTEATKLTVKQLLKDGRFEFINGGYVMHDEAASYYQHYIDQMRLGLQFLKNEFNYRPEVAWFIDPFGHSASNAYILSKMGFTKMAFSRIDYNEKNIRRAEKKLEFYWKPFGQIDDNTKIFTHITYEHYCPPDSMSGLDMDKEIDISHDDLVYISEEIVNDLKKWSSGFKHKNVMLMYGCDFTFNKADINYKNLELVMDYINSSHKDIKLFYSTPSKYFKTILEQVQEWPEYNNQDFFPYADNPYSYWTGYLTSRPFLKGLVRETGNYLISSSKFILEYYLINPTSKSVIDALSNQFFLRENLAYCQHHDAVAGTAKQHVSEDYESRLNASILKTQETFINILQETVPEMRSADIKVCISSPHTNIKCQEAFSMKDEQNLLVVISNPGLNGKYPITIDLPKTSGIEVHDTNGEIITSDLFCLDDSSFTDEFICKLKFFYTFDKSKASMSIKLVKISGDNSVPRSPLHGIKKILITNDFEVVFNFEMLKFETKIKSSTNETNQTYNYDIRHGFYNGYNGSNSKIKPENMNPDGAYIFSTVEELPNYFRVDSSRSFVHTGKLSTQLTIRFDNSYLILNILRGPFLIEIESIWDPIQDRSSGKDFMLIVNSDIENSVKLPDGQTQPEIWTDSNGIKMMRRFKDFRQGWKYILTDKVSGNFFPVNRSISIRDRVNYQYSDKDYEGMNVTDRVLTIYNERSQSGGTMDKGQMMLLVHRFSEKDDWKGVGEPLFEKSSGENYFRTKHILCFSNAIEQYYIENLIQNKPALFAIRGLDKEVNIETMLGKLVDCTSNIIINYYQISQYKLYVQAFNIYDPYFNSNSTNQYIEENITFKSVPSVTYKLTEYHMSSVEPLSVGISKGFLKRINPSPLRDTSYPVARQDFRLFLLEFTPFGGIEFQK